MPGTLTLLSMTANTALGYTAAVLIPLAFGIVYGGSAVATASLTLSVPTFTFGGGMTLSGGTLAVGTTTTLTWTTVGTLTGTQIAELGLLGTLMYSVDPNRVINDYLLGRLRSEFPSQYLQNTINELKEMIKAAKGSKDRIDLDAIEKAKKIAEQMERLMKKIR